jgi:hypothetical protein
MFGLSDLDFTVPNVCYWPKAAARQIGGECPVYPESSRSRGSL